MEKKPKEEYYGPAIRQLLIAIDNGNDYKKWLRKELRRKGFVNGTRTKFQDKMERRRFKLSLIQEQKLIVQFRKAIKVLRKASSSNQ